MNNREQNRQFRDAVKEIERQLGDKLTDDQKQLLHREISGMGYDFHEIIRLGLVLFS